MKFMEIKPPFGAPKSTPYIRSSSKQENSKWPIRAIQETPQNQSLLIVYFSISVKMEEKLSSIGLLPSLRHPNSIKCNVAW